jgi:hypothetical protein
MKRISVETVEQVYTRLWEMSEAEAFQLSYVLEKEQPLLLAYLAAVDEGILNQAEREVMFYQATAIWQIMSHGKKSLPQVQEADLMYAESENLKIADSLKDADTVSFAEVVKRILQDCSQPEVFRYVVAALLDQDNEDCVIRDENLGIIMLDLKTVIDCYDRLEDHGN